MHFFGKGNCKKCTGMRQRRKRRAKRVYCKSKMPIIFIKGSCVETPLYTMCWINEDGDKGQAMRKGGGAEGGGGVDTRREGLSGQSV